MKKVSPSCLLNIPTIDTEVLFHQLELHLFTREYTNNYPFQGYDQIKTHSFQEFMSTFFLYHIDSQRLVFADSSGGDCVEGFVNVLKHKDLLKRIDSFFNDGNNFLIEKFLLLVFEPFLQEYNKDIHQNLSFKVEVLEDYSPQLLMIDPMAKSALLSMSVFNDFSHKVSLLILDYKTTSDLTPLVLFFITEFSLFKKFIAYTQLKHLFNNSSVCSL